MPFEILFSGEYLPSWFFSGRLFVARCFLFLRRIPGSLKSFEGLGRGLPSSLGWIQLLRPDDLPGADGPGGIDGRDLRAAAHLSHAHGPQPPAAFAAAHPAAASAAG